MLGIGLNVDVAEFPPELRDTATSLGIAGGVEPVLSSLLGALGRWLDAPAAEVLAAWRQRDALKGERVGWGEGEGVAAGIDDSGALLVDSDTGRVALDAGEVHLSPPS